MIAPLAPRILNIPDDIRAALARVDGPGWAIYEYGIHAVRCSPYMIVLFTGPDEHDDPAARQAWWPCSPAASVAAVTGWALSACYAVITVRLQGGCDDDHAAALAIIEAHVAGRGTL